MAADASILPLRDASNLRHRKLGIAHTLPQCKGDSRRRIEHVLAENHNRVRGFNLRHARQACGPCPVDAQRQLAQLGLNTAQPIAEVLAANQRLQCGIGFQRRPG